MKEEHRLEASINKYKHIISSQISILDHTRINKIVKIESLILVWISPAATKVSPHLYAAHVQVAHSSRQFDSTQPQSASMILPKLAPTKNKNRF